MYSNILLLTVLHWVLSWPERTKKLPSQGLCFWVDGCCSIDFWCFGISSGLDIGFFCAFYRTIMIILSSEDTFMYYHDIGRLCLSIFGWTEQKRDPMCCCSCCCTEGVLF